MVELTDSTSYEVIAEYLTAGIRSAYLSVRQADRQAVSELRLNSGRAAAMVFPDKIMYLTHSGLTANPRNTSTITVMPTDISAIVDALSHYSIHSCSRQLCEGVFVLRKGVRVGLSGSFNSEGCMTEITGLNFRISRNIQGCADEVYKLVSQSNQGIVICGGVNSGKTTILRDLCRMLGSVRKTVLVDERNEIACTNGGIIENDVGILTNVLTGCSRVKGIVSAVRTLSPDYIFCDEISTDDDAAAIMENVGCGVKFCATVHGTSFQDLRDRSVMKTLLNAGIFGYAVILDGGNHPGKIREIRRLNDDI